MAFDFKDGSGCGKTLSGSTDLFSMDPWRVQSKMAGIGRCDCVAIDLPSHPSETALHTGATAHDVHRAVSAGFTQRGYHLGHVTGHSIGMTMIEHPKIGEGIETELATNMVFSMHPHAIAADGVECLYMQDTWLVTEDGGIALAGLPMQIFQ